MNNNISNIEGKMILADGQYYDMDCYKTQLNNNVLVVGTSGSGKTRSIVTPNILQAEGSYIIVDPKGNLHEKYAAYLRKKGYRVRKLNFADPGDPNSCTYNPFEYIRNEQDILKLAHMMVKSDNRSGRSYSSDPFWDEAAELLLISIIAYLYEHDTKDHRNLQNIFNLLQKCDIEENYSDRRNSLDYLFDKIGKQDPDDFSYRTYKRFRQAASRTLMSILITLSAKLGVFDTSEIRRLFEKDSVHIKGMGCTKTALFVVVSDTDRSMDMMVNVFFTQAMNELCRVADSMRDNRLPVDVRFILDDFATNVRIEGFPRMIASIRSRGISAMLMIQAEAQLRNAYNDDGRTIIGNCDTYVYLGGNDVDTAVNIAKRANVPLAKILYMPVGTNWIFRRGQQPVQSQNFDLTPFLREKMAGVEVDRS